MVRSEFDIQDAFILGLLLADKKSQLHNVDQVLRIYEKIRLPLSQTAAEKSRLNGLSTLR